MKFNLLNDTEKQAVVNLKEKLAAKGRPVPDLDPNKAVVGYRNTGKFGCVTICVIKKTAKALEVFPGWAKYRLSDLKQEKHKRNQLFGQMQSFSRAVQDLALANSEEEPEITQAATA